MTHRNKTRVLATHLAHHVPIFFPFRRSLFSDCAVQLVLEFDLWLMKAVHVWVPTQSPGKEDLLSFRPVTKSDVYKKTLGIGAPILEAKQPLQ